MQDLFDVLRDMEGTGLLYMLILAIGFLGIVIYVFTGKKRAKRFDQDAEIPFLDDESKMMKVKGPSGNSSG